MFAGPDGSPDDPAEMEASSGTGSSENGPAEVVELTATRANGMKPNRFGWSGKKAL